MRKLFAVAALAFLALGLLAVAGCSGSASTSTPSTPSASSSGASSSSGSSAGGSVSISNFAFSPADVTIKSGESVTWTNNDSVAHTVTGTGFDSGEIASGATFSHTFPTAGSFDYHCSIHPSMTGKVTVQ